MREAKKCEIINVRIADTLKNESKEILDREGINHSKAIRLLLEYIVRHKKLPFDIEDKKD